MSVTLLETPTAATPHTTVQYSTAAPNFLKAQTGWSLPYPLSLLFDSESQAKWQSYENVFLACLRTGDVQSAKKCLDDITRRFGLTNERVRALTGLYQEATADGEQGLVAVLNSYDDILKFDPASFSIRKRRAALLRTLGRTADAIAAVINILDASPTDAEAWAELADLYFSQGLYEPSIHCWEEVLVAMPNAWNVQARLAEVLYISAAKGNANEQLQGYAESIRRYCRSIELCDDYLRGYYGLKLVSGKLRDLLTQGKAPVTPSNSTSGNLAVPSLAKVEKLNELATSKLAEIIRKSSSGDKEWDGYNPAEIAAARQLLNEHTHKK